MLRLGVISKCYPPPPCTTTSRIAKLRAATICTRDISKVQKPLGKEQFNNRPIHRLRPTVVPSSSLQLHTLYQRPATIRPTIHAFSTKADDGSDKEEHKEPTSSTVENTTDDTTKPVDNDNDNDEEKRQREEDEKLFRETMERLQADPSPSSSKTKAKTESSTDQNDLLSTVSSAFQSFTGAVGDTWNELLDSSKPRDINKKMTDIHKSRPGSVSDDDHEAAEKYTGSTAVMVIDESENINAFERIQRRLSEAPIIQDVLRKSEELYETSGAAKAHEKLTHIKEDARETWETSQNPWIYRASSVYETLTAESEYGATERELRVLDPEFSLESWKNDVVEVTLPNFMQLFLEGRIKELKPSLGESVYNRMAAESRVRKKEGVYVDTNVLGIMNSDIVSCNPDTVNKGSPIIVLHYMCQQINCVRKKKTGEVVEGSEDDIRAYSYVVAFQREYDEEKGELNWKVVDFMLNGAIAYL